MTGLTGDEAEAGAGGSTATSSRGSVQRGLARHRSRSRSTLRRIANVASKPLELPAQPGQVAIPLTSRRTGPDTDIVGPMVRISKLKWATSTGGCAEAFSWSAEVLGTDQHGTWLGSLRGNPVRQPDGRVEPQRYDAVWLAVAGAWYFPTFWFTTETDLTIDVCTPPQFEDGTWTFVDMELDLFRRRDGRAGVVDQDDWDLLVGSRLISDHVVRTVEDTARALLTLVEQRVEPFGDAAMPWLRTLRHSPP